MIGLLCAFLAGGTFYLSIGLGEAWPLAWVAPVPALWYALRPDRAVAGFFVAIGVYALGGLNLLPAYLGILPAPVLVMAILGPALLFALAVFAARLTAKALGTFAAIAAFATLWSAFDFLLAFDPSGGSVLTPAASQVAAPPLIQIAAVTGFSGVTLVIGAVAGALALALHRRRVSLALLAAAIFAANFGFGAWRMAPAPQDMLRVALIASDDAVGAIRSSDEARARAVLARYAREVKSLQGVGVDLVVLPENIARLDAGWRRAALAPLADAARVAGGTVIVGFNTDLERGRGNVAWAALPSGATALYGKRQLVPGLETSQYARGTEPLALAGGVMIAICKDMDFPDMIRADVAATAPRLIAVPAWDFGADGWSHARVAILRGVENGVAVARTARDGMLTLADRHGRIVALGRSSAGFSKVVADLPLAVRAEPTLYALIGPLFGWACLVIGTALSVMVLMVSRREAPKTANT